jgi:hypothetical protein
MTVLSVKSPKTHADAFSLHSKCLWTLIMPYLFFTELQCLVASIMYETWQQEMEMNIQLPD